jgi:5'-deoxynucleotidase YfbR-like HD superfamily hydrolase
VYDVVGEEVKMNRLKELYDAGSVTRFHTKRVIKSQTIADHSWGVALIALEIAHDPSIELVKAVLYHDLAESVTGDTPATAKWVSNDLKTSLQKLEDNFNKRLGLQTQLSEEEEEVLKWADMIELIMYCNSESALGNAAMKAVARTGIDYLYHRIPPTVKASMLLERLNEQSK